MTKTKKKKSGKRAVSFKSLVESGRRPPAEVAEAAEISRSYIYDLMKGTKTAPKPWVIVRLAAALGETQKYVTRCLKLTRDAAA